MCVGEGVHICVNVCKAYMFLFAYKTYISVFVSMAYNVAVVVHGLYTVQSPIHTYQLDRTWTVVDITNTMSLSGLALQGSAI